MNANTLLSIIFCCQTILCTQPNVSELCKKGSAEEVITALHASFADTEALHHEAQLCFFEAVDGNNIEVLEALPKNYPISPNILFREHLPGNWAAILLKSNWLFNGQMVSGQELIMSHLNGIIEQILPGHETANMIKIFNIAAELGYLGVIKAMVPGKYVDISSRNFEKAFYSAFDHGHINIVRYILGLKTADKSWLYRVFRDTCHGADLKLVKILCEEFGVDPNVSNGFAALWGAKSGSVDLMNYLISRGLILSLHSNKAFYEACRLGHAEMVKFLLSFEGVDPARKDNQALRYASSKRYQEVVDILLQNCKVLAALNSSQVNEILADPVFCNTKLTLLYWMAYNMKDVDMSWILDFKKQMLAHPELFDQYRAILDQKIAELVDKRLDHIANFIEAWADSLKSYANAVAAFRNTSTELDDIFEAYLSVTLPHRF